MCLLGPWVILIPIGSSTWQLIKTQSFSERPYMSLKQKHIVINYYYYNYYLHCMCLCIFREAGPHGSNIPKPESFHSLENGYYIYLLFLQKHPDTRATIIGPVRSWGATYCPQTTRWSNLFFRGNLVSTSGTVHQKTELSDPWSLSFDLVICFRMFSHSVNVSIWRPWGWPVSEEIEQARVWAIWAQRACLYSCSLTETERNPSCLLPLCALIILTNVARKYRSTDTNKTMKNESRIPSRPKGRRFHIGRPELSQNCAYVTRQWEKQLVDLRLIRKLLGEACCVYSRKHGMSLNLDWECL